MALLWNPADKHADITLSNGDVRMEGGGSWRSARATGPARSSGRWAFAFYPSGGSNRHGIGISQPGDSTLGWYVGGYSTAVGYFTYSSGGWWNGGSSSQVAGQGIDDWWVIACDFDALEIRLFDKTGAQIGAAGAIPAGAEWLPTGSLESSGRFIDISDDPADGWAMPDGYEAWSKPPATHRVAGEVEQDDQAAVRTIRVYDDGSGELLAEQSSAGGQFDIGLASGDPVFVVGVPAAGYQPIVLGPISPAVLADYRAAVLASNPLHYWTMEAGGGDLGSSPRTLAVNNGSPVLGAASLHSQGAAADYDGNSSHDAGGVWGDLAGADGATVELLLQPDALGFGQGYHTAFTANVSSNTGLFVGFFPDGRWYVGGRSSVGESFKDITTVAGDVAVGTTYHLALVLDLPADLMTLYINGAQFAQESEAFSNTAFPGGGASCYIGRNNGGNSFDGRAQDIAVYPRALPVAEIADHYAQLQGVA